MTSKLNRCYWQAASAGTGAFVYDSTVAGYLSPANAEAENGAEYAVIAEVGSPPTEWEISIGVYDSGTGTITRDTIVESSNGGAAVDFSAVPKVRMGVPLAADFPGALQVHITGSGMPPVVEVGPIAVWLDGEVLQYRPAIYNLLYFAEVETFSTNAQAILGALSIDGASALTSLEFPDLQIVVGAVLIQNNAALSSVDLGALKIADLIGITTNAVLETIDVSSLLRIAPTVDLSGNALDEASVDGILVKFASLDGTGGTSIFQNGIVDLSGGTSAPPSAAGLAAKTTLEGRGCTVTVNS